MAGEACPRGQEAGSVAAAEDETDSVTPPDGSPDDRADAPAGSATGPRPPDEVIPPNPRRVLIAFIVAGAFLMQGIDSTLLTTAIPTIARGLGVPALSLHVAVTAYMISLAVFMPLSSWFADRLGARRVFCGALLVFVAGSGLCGAADSLPLLVLARIVQGLGGAVMTPVGRLILLRAFGTGGTLDAMTYLTTPLVLGPMLGPLMGAGIVTYMSWRWIFFVNLPLCAIALAAALAFVPRDTEVGARIRFDIPGFLIAATAILLFQLAVENLAAPLLGRPASLGLLAGAVGTAFVYTRYARRCVRPALDVSLFGLRAYRAGVIGGGLSRIGLNASNFLLPLLLQLGFGMTAIQSGMLTAIGAFGALGAKFLLRRMIRSSGFRPVMLSLVGLGAALLGVFPVLNGGGSYVVLVPSILLLSAVRSMQFNTANSLTYADVPPKLLSRSVSSAGVFQQLSMSLGISVSATILSLVTGPGGAPGLGDFSVTFACMAGITLTALPPLMQLDRADGVRRPPGG